MAVHSSGPCVHPQKSIKALNAQLHYIHKERWKPSIKNGLHGWTEITWIWEQSLRGECQKAASSLRPERVVQIGPFLLQRKQWPFSPMAGCDSAVIKRDLWEADGRSWGLNAERGLAGIIYSQLPNILPLPLERSPFPCPPIGRLIILSLRQWPNLHVILWAENAKKKRASAEVEIGCTDCRSFNETTTMWDF